MFLWRFKHKGGNMNVKTRNTIYLICVTFILACMTGCQENNVQKEETTAVTPETVQEGKEEVRIEKDVVSITFNYARSIEDIILP